jgi:hypothetical protein
MRPGAALVLMLIQLTGADGNEVDVNPAGIITLRDLHADQDSFHDAVHCVIRTEDGTFFGVRETCTEIRDKIRYLEER